MIRFKCGGCGKQYNVPTETAGRQARCKQCGVMFHVPVPRSATGVAVDAANLDVSTGSSSATTLGPAELSRPLARVVGNAGPGIGAARAAQPLAGSFDLDAFDPFEGSALDDAAGVSYRPTKKSNLGLWFLLGGGVIGVCGMVAAAIMLIINNLPARPDAGPGTTAQAWSGAASSGTPSSPPALSGDMGVYMPANWSMAASFHPRQFVDHAHLLPALKQGLEQALAKDNLASGDMRKLDEILYVQDGGIVYLAITSSSAGEMARLRGKDVSLETYRGLQLYQTRTNTTPGALPAALQQSQVFYSFTPTDRMIIGVNDLGRLKASIDAALAGRTSTFLLARQKTFNVQVKNVKDLEGPSAARGNPLTDGIVGFTMSADLNNQLDLAAVLDMKDAQAATNFQSQISLALTMAKTQLASEFAPVLDAIQLSASGDQVHFNGSLPYHLVTKLTQPGQTPLAMPGMPWPQSTPMPGTPMPGQAMSGQLPPGFTPPGGYQPPQPGAGTFPGSVQGLTGPGLSGRRPGGMRPPTIQPPRTRPPVRPPRMRPPGRIR